VGARKTFGRPAAATDLSNPTDRSDETRRPAGFSVQPTLLHGAPNKFCALTQAFG
jgi:hypothetical protein